MSRCEGEQMWEKMWRWADVKMSRCERRCEDEQMWRWADVREDVKMSRCEDEKMWEKMWRWADVKMRRCERRCEDEQMWRWADVREDVKMSRCEDEKMWRCERRCEDEQMLRRCEDEQMWRWEDVEKMWRWADVKMSRCERRCEDEQMWRWEDVREDVKMSRCEDEKMWEKMWRWADVKMSRCERRCEDEQMWRWEDVEMRRCERRCEDEQMWRWEDVEKMWRWADVKMSRCERRCEDEQMWRWEDVREDVKMSRCEDEKMWEKMWRWADVREDVKMSRCEDEKMWRWEDVREDVKMSRCEDEKMWRCEDEQMWRWEDVEKMWRWADVREDVKMSRCLEDVKMRRCFTDPHYWKNPALRRSREKSLPTHPLFLPAKWQIWPIFAEALMISRVPLGCHNLTPTLWTKLSRSKATWAALSGSYRIDGDLLKSHHLTDIDTARLIPEPGGFLQCFNLVLGSPADLRFTERFTMHHVIKTSQCSWGIRFRRWAAQTALSKTQTQLSRPLCWHTFGNGPGHRKDRLPSEKQPINSINPIFHQILSPSWCRITFMATNLLSLSAQGHTSVPYLKMKIKSLKKPASNKTTETSKSKWLSTKILDTFQTWLKTLCVRLCIRNSSEIHHIHPRIPKDSQVDLVLRIFLSRNSIRPSHPRYHGEDAHTQGFVAHHGVRSHLATLDMISQVRFQVALVAP